MASETALQAVVAPRPAGDAAALPGLASAIVQVAALACLATVAPLTVYTVSLALFGLPHVLAELRYVDQRFTARLGRRLWVGLTVLLLGVAGVRLAGLADIGDGMLRLELEFVLVLALMAVVLPTLWRRGGALAVAIGAAAILVVGLGAATAPLATIVVLAFLHNVTPVGFLAERLRGRTRRRVLLACGAVFVAVPALLISGLPARLLADVAWLPDPGLPGTGTVGDHLQVFVPLPWLDRPFAVDLFRAAAYLQCVHYACVLHLLPRLGPGDQAGGARLPWPHRGFVLAVAALAVPLTIGFLLSFGEARAVYAVFAALHAWIELPVLLLAVALPAVAPRGAGATAR